MLTSFFATDKTKIRYFNFFSSSSNNSKRRECAISCCTIHIHLNLQKTDSCSCMHFKQEWKSDDYWLDWLKSKPGFVFCMSHVRASYVCMHHCETSIECTQPLLLCVSQEWLCGENVLETQRGCGSVPEIRSLAQRRHRVKLLPRMFSPSHFNQCSQTLLALQSARDISPLNNGSRQWLRSR